MKNSTEYSGAYRAANKERLKDYRRSYYEANKKQEAALHRQYRKRIRYKTLERRDFISAVKLYYGCCNPDCCWDGPFTPSMLDFHHIDKAEKKYPLGWSRHSFTKADADEINKCTVLCAICHRLETWEGLDCSNFQRCNVTADMKLVGAV